MLPYLFFLTAEISYVYGVAGLLYYSFSWIFITIAVYFIRMKAEYLLKDTTLFSVLRAIYIIETLTCTFLVFKMLFGENLFRYTIITYIIVIFIVPIVMFYIYIWNRKSLIIGTVFLSIMLSFLIPILVYLKISIPTVYSGIHFLYQEMIQLNHLNSLPTILALSVIFSMQHLIYLKSKHSEEAPSLFSFLITGVIMCCITLSFGTISFLGRAQAVLPDLPDRVTIQVVNRFSGQIGQLLLLITLVYLTIFFLIKIIPLHRSSLNLKSCFKNVLYVCIGLLLASIFNLTIINTLLIFGFVWASILGSIIFSSKKPTINKLVIFFSLITGILISMYFPVSIAILVTAIFSLFLTSISFFANYTSD